MSADYGKIELSMTREALNSYNNEMTKVNKAVLERINLDAIERISNAVKISPGIYEAVNVFNGILYEQQQRLGQAGVILSKEIIRILEAQSTMVMQIEISKQTEMIKAMRNCMVQSNLSGCIDVMSKTLQKAVIDAVDFSFLKTAEITKVMRQESLLPKGIKSALDCLNVSSAQRLLNSNNITFDLKTKSFINLGSNNSASPQEMNVICAGSDIFDKLEEDFISENELMDFMTLLSETPSFASQAPTGMKIRELIRDNGSVVGFDHEFYYHARHREEDSIPYVAAQMKEAPYGKTGPGRYNHPGQAYYYFSDTADGAESEVRKHIQKGVIQVAKVKVVSPIRMLDLSGTMRGGKTFLRYIRFSLKDSGCQPPNQYLIPCYVSDCCRMDGIDGVKYYGSQSYTNYVSWKTGYFEFEQMIR